jgi:DNA-3-methyladenine glycosylase
VETEAYLGPEDAASHAAFRPGSHALFYGDGGFAYVYLNYGIHRCLNAIAGPAGRPGCVLIRAVEPLRGLTAMARRRGVPLPGRLGRQGPTPATACGAHFHRDQARVASGPGNLTRALGITLEDNGADLTRGRLTVEPPEAPRAFHVASGPRIGITRARESRLRFWIAGNRFVSR